MSKKQKIDVQGTTVTVIQVQGEDYISLTDMIQRFGDDSIIKNWLRNRNTIEFLGIWETIHNPSFNSVEFDLIRNLTGLNSFAMSVKRWIEATQAIGMRASTGRYGGTYAHKDIAFEFGSWLSPEFKLYLLKEFQRMKEVELESSHSEWSIQRMLTKMNYHLHTAAVKENLIPPTLLPWQINQVFATEGDLLNLALFGKTASEWRKENPSLPGNQRDHATIEQLVVLSNIESINAILIQSGRSQAERLQRLNAIAIQQVRTLVELGAARNLKLSA